MFPIILLVAVLGIGFNAGQQTENVKDNLPAKSSFHEKKEYVSNYNQH